MLAATEAAPPPPPASPSAPAPAPASAPGSGPSRAAWAAPWVLSTYFAEGLPYSIVHQISAELFTSFGASLQAIGHTALYGFAWNFKFLWGPVVDLRSTTRRWLIGLELALAVLVAAVALPADRGDLVFVAWVFAAISFLAATHDIAVDGFYLRALGQSDQAALSGLRVSGYRAALWVGRGLLVGLAGKTSWLWCFLVAGGLLLALALLHAAFLPREVRRPAAEASKVRFVEAFTTFLKQPKIAVSLGFILLFRAGDAMMFAMSTPLLKELGLGTAERAFVSGTLGMLAGVGSSVLGGVLIGRFGLARTLRPIAALQSVAILLYVWMAWARPSVIGISAIVILEQVAAGVGTSAFMVFLMRRCAGAYKASHFAIASALMSVATTLAGTASGHIASATGFPVFFAIAFAASIPGVVLSFWVPVEE